MEKEFEPKCGSEGYLIKGFEMCSRLYRKVMPYYGHPKDAMLMCTDGCIQQAISSSIFYKEKSCSVISQHAFGNYSVCFAQCGGCFLPISWSLIYDMLENLPNNFINKFAEECAREFRKGTNEESPLSLARKAKSFIDLAKEKRGVDVSKHFTEFTSQDDIYNTGYVCEFRRNNFNLSCLGLSLITVTILILTIIAFVCVYQSGLQSSLNRSGQGRIVELTLLSNNR
jgi:hypothetical protein